jgi:hypothetical protein
MTEVDPNLVMSSSGSPYYWQGDTLMGPQGPVARFEEFPCLMRQRAYGERIAEKAYGRR